MIEVALGYHDMASYRDLHDRVEALGPAVVEVVYRGDPPAWLVNTARVVAQCDSAVVLNIKGVPAGQTVCMVPFALYERLLQGQAPVGEMRGQQHA